MRTPVKRIGLGSRAVRLIAERLCGSVVPDRANPGVTCVAAPNRERAGCGWYRLWTVRPARRLHARL